MSTTPTISKSPATGKPKVIGIYGIPGSGKTFLLKQLESRLQGSGHFAFYDSSRVISSIAPGGLKAFQRLSDPEKARYRQDGIIHIGKDCETSGRTGIVAGHGMFWDEGQTEGTFIHTRDDLETYTHILYLDVPAQVVLHRRLTDNDKKRVSMSVEHLSRWQREEKSELRRLCMDHDILFMAVSTVEEDLADAVSALVQDFRLHSEELNLRCAAMKLDQVLDGKLGKLETVLLMDGDRTLAAEDTGALFWNALPRTHNFIIAEDPFKTLFSSPMGYSHAAFRQASLLYREAASHGRFDEICDAVAAEVRLYQQLNGLLALAAASEHAHAVVVTCGLAPIWQRVLDKAGLGMVRVIGCEPAGTVGGLTITPEVKGALVSRLQETHHCRVIAFGDSPLDLPMLSKADQAIVVVGEEDRRSRTMETALLDAIANYGLQAQQLLLPRSVSPRLNDARLPLVELADPDFLHSVFLRRQHQTVSLGVHTAPSIAAKLLMTPTRNATVAGPSLREAHRQIGRFLAVELVANLVGVEEYAIPHVQGHMTQGHRLAHEEETLIVALMRGGEPMAFGVNDAFPLAMFLHAKQPQDLMLHHVKDRKTVLLVDSVVNNGKTAVEFIQRVRDLNVDVRIVMVAGVVQSQAVTGDKPLAKVLMDDNNLDIVALRLSDNQYTGRGSTDTGNRLFNTTKME